MKVSAFFSYVFNMPCEKICADIKEYFNLRKKYNEVNYKCTQLHDMLGDGKTFGCMSFNTEEDKSWFTDNKRVSYCENFFHKNCDVAECACVGNHNLYWKLMDERKKLMTAKAEFWDAKFQNVR